LNSSIKGLNSSLFLEGQPEAWALMFDHAYVVALLEDHGSIRQAFRSRALRRKIAGEQRADLSDSGNHAGFEFAPAKRLFHALTDGIPLLLGDSRVDTAVAHDFDVAIGEQQVNKHTCVLFRVPHAKLGEDLNRPLPRADPTKQRRQVQRGLHSKPDLAAVNLLGFPDYGLNHTERARRKRPSGNPGRGE
jgi:hypothetical protein